MANKQFCSFRLDQHHFIVDILVVQEIIREMTITRVPMAPPVIGGLVNLRGQIITAINLRQRIGLPINELVSASVHIVIQTNDGLISLLVDTIGDMVELDDDDYVTTPTFIDEQAREMISGVYKTAKGLYLLLDTNKVAAIEIPVIETL
jgi:purine-binding chemotaxis protein CheW